MTSSIPSGHRRRTVCTTKSAEPTNVSVNDPEVLQPSVNLIDVAVPRLQVTRVDRGREPVVDVIAKHHLPELVAKANVCINVPGRNQEQREQSDPQPPAPVVPQPRTVGSNHKARDAEDERQKQRRHELRQEAEDEVEAHRSPMPGAQPGRSAIDRPEVVIDTAAIGEQQRRLHVVLAEPVLQQQRAVHEQDEHRSGSADRTCHALSDREHVEEGDAAEDDIPEPEAELVVGKQPCPDWRGDNPELQRRLLEEVDLFVRTAARSAPVAQLEDAVDRVGINGLVVPEIRATESDEERQAEKNDDQSQPGWPAQSFTHVTSDQIRGTFTFSIETGCSSDCARNAGRSRSALKPM